MASGAISGAATGATLGSVVPGLGTTAGAIIGGVAGLGGDIANYFTNKGAAKKQYKYNKQLMAQQNAYNVENWQMQNDYNLPTAQRLRLKAAGLNPDLMYQNGASGLTAASAAPVSGSSVGIQSPTDFHGLANGSAMAIQLENATKLADSEVALNKAKEDNLNKQTDWIDGINTATIKKIQKDCQMTDQQIEQSKAMIRQINSVVDLNKVIKQIDEVQLEINQKTKDDLIDSLSAQYKCNKKVAEVTFDYALKKAKLECQLLAAQAYSAKATGDTSYMNAYTNRLQENLNELNGASQRALNAALGSKANADESVSRAEAMGQYIENGYKDELFSSEIGVNKAKAFRLYLGNPHVSAGNKLFNMSVGD